MDLSPLISLTCSYCDDESREIQNPPGASIFRKQAVSGLEAVLYEPVMCLILQGSKVTSIGDQRVELHPGDALLVSHDLPVVSRITKASRQEPYLAAILSLDIGLVRSLYEQVGETLTPSTAARSLSAGRADPAWFEPFCRYFALANRPLDAKVLGQSILREIHYRLLISPMGGMLRNLLSVDSHASRVARAISEIRTEFRAALIVSDLAKTAGMSPSSFHEHFKSVTGTTPLQYQKDLRLLEARNLIADESNSVSAAAYAVGYESPTHFSRDYSRKFGSPPSRDAGAFASYD